MKIGAGGLGGAQAFALEKLHGTKKKAKADSDEEEDLPRWMASYEIPQVLQLFPKADGRIVVAAKVEVTSTEGKETEWVNFAVLAPTTKTKNLSFRRTMVEVDGVPIH